MTEENLSKQAESLRSRAMLFGHKAPGWLVHSKPTVLHPGRTLQVFSVDDGLWFLDDREIATGDKEEKTRGDGKAEDREGELGVLLESLQNRSVDVPKVGHLLAIAKAHTIKLASLRSDSNVAMNTAPEIELQDATLAAAAMRRFASRKFAVAFPDALLVRLAADATELERYIERGRRVWAQPDKPQGRPKAGNHRPWIFAELRALGVSEETARDLLVSIGVAKARPRAQT